MAALLARESQLVGLRLLLCPLGSNFVVRTACCSVGIVLPVYNTFKAIENNDQRDQKKWLVYWAAYGSFSLVEVFSDKILSWFPLYYHVKLAFLVWLQLPSTEEAKQLYRRHIRPFLLKHQARFDQITGITYNETAKFMSAHQSEYEFAKTLFVKVYSSAHQMIRGTIHPLEPPQNQNAIEAPPANQNQPEQEDHDD